MRNSLSHIIHLKETTSTSDYLRELLKSKELEEGTVVSADFQTAGKGQRGNVWQSSTSENLLFSIILYPHSVIISEQFIISQCVALAVKDILLEYVSYIKIKWPNDIYWKNQKICGMLIENNIDNGKISSSIIGIGININQNNFSNTLSNQPVSLKNILNKEIDKQEILEEVIQKILFNYQRIKDGLDKEISSEYKKDLYSTGFFKDLKTMEKFNAQITDIESNGTLILTDENSYIRRYLFKEVEFVVK